MTTKRHDKEKLSEKRGQCLADLTANEVKILRVRFGLEPGMDPDEEERRLQELARQVSRLRKK